MAPSSTLLLQSASTAYSPTATPVGYALHGETISNEYGLYVTTYKQIGGSNYIVSFRGTENAPFSASSKDWVNNFNEGWPQYRKDAIDIARIVDSIILRDNISQVHIVGHSLGGALAQFAAYDFAVRHAGNHNKRITLTTWNGLGGEWGLRTNRQFNAAHMNGIEANHYFRIDDLVAKLGGSHVGGKTIALYPPTTKFAGIKEAHSIEAISESLNNDHMREGKPNYHNFTKVSREYVGTILASLLETTDPEIEGNGIHELFAKGLLQPRAETGLAIAELVAFIVTISAERLANDPSIATQAADKVLASIIKAVADNPTGLATIAGLITNTALNLLSGETTNSRQIIGELLIRYVEQFEKVGSDAAGLLLLLAEMLTQSENFDLSRLPREYLLIHPTLEPHGPGLLPLLEPLQERMRRAEQRRQETCPLIVDLDGDGIETLTLEAGIYFDHDGNGFAERTGWVSPRDGLLAWDRNGNGLIDAGAELFGNNTLDKYGAMAANGFEALAALDANQDGVINLRDAIWEKLGIWQDRNSNAKLESGEWFSMAGAGISKLLLQYQNSDAFDQQGNQHRQFGSYQTSRGEDRAVTDVWFRIDAARSVDLNTIELDPYIQTLPNIVAIGSVASLHQAMQRDSSGILRRMIEQWQRSSDEQQKILINNLIFHWTGVQDHPTDTQPWLSDARILAALERFLGINFRGGAGIENQLMAREVQEMFHELGLQISKLLNSRGIRDPFLKRLDARWNKELQQIDWQVDRSISYLLEPTTDRINFYYLKWLQSSLVEMGDEGRRILSKIRSQLISNSDHSIKILAPLLTTYSVPGAPTSFMIDYSHKDIYVKGQQGNDILDGYHGNDILEGGEGDDQLHGRWGSDIYLFGSSFGNDTIYEINEGYSKNLALFTEHSASEVTAIECLANNLIVRFIGDNKLTISDYFKEMRWATAGSQFSTPIDAFHFRDGTVWRYADISRHAVIIGATEGVDVMGGYKNIIHIIDGLDGDDDLLGDNLDDILDGNSGYDYLDGGLGNDILRGGSGDDSIFGGGGRDTYIYALGDGDDIIMSNHALEKNDFGLLKFEKGIRPEDVFMAGRNELMGDLTLGLTKNNDRITIRSFFRDNDYTNSYNPIHQISFEDGTIWDRAMLAAKSMLGSSGDDRIPGSIFNDKIVGDAGNDHLFGFAGDDTLIGGDGNDWLSGGRDNDILYGGEGNNTFMFQIGDGHDTIMADHALTSRSSTARILFSQEILPQQVEYHRLGNNLKLSIQGANDSVTIQEFFRDNQPLNARNPVLNVFFRCDGSLLRANQVPAGVTKMILGTSSANTLTGTEGDDFIGGLAHNDILDGRGGNDVIDGGDGIDTATYAYSQGAVRVDLSIRTIQDTGLSGWDKLIAIENLTGSAYDDVLLGNGEANLINGGAGNDWIDGGSGDDILIGGSNDLGGDTIAYTNAVSGVTVSLAISNAQATGGAGSDTISEFENLSGSRFNDVLTGCAGANRIQGGDGNDILWGSAGRDHHSGGAGADHFLYRSAADAGNGLSGRDVITDFETSDRINLSRIDANSSLSGKQAFLWIGSAAFSAPGQLRYTTAKGNGLLEGNISGSSGAEFQIEIQGGFALQPGIHVVL
jgi:Ca2+-binding RTX toxin-like protein